MIDARPLLIDLFCGAGGAAEGYRRAGFRVIGVDIARQRHFPLGDMHFIQAEALAWWDANQSALERAVAFHASPPCQGYSRMNHVHKREYPLLIEPVRERFQAAGKPYVIENVEGAPLIAPITLCGSSFDLKVLRHRIFESNVDLIAPPCKSHVGEFYSPAGHGDPNWRHHEKNPHLKGIGYTERCRQAMGISWMNRDELAEAIPPAYTEWIGKQLMEVVNARDFVG